MYIKRCGSIYEVVDLAGDRRGYFGRVSDLASFGMYFNGIDNHWVLDLYGLRPRFFLSFHSGFKYISSLEV